MEEADLGSNGETRMHQDKKGKWISMFVCMLLGNGTLLTWTSMVAAQDYYNHLFPKYHPTRILTVVYQPFSVVFVSIFAHYEAKINTRLRILVGYSIFFCSSLAVIILDFASGGKGGIGPFIGLCMISSTFGVSDALVSGGMVGDLSLMCPHLVQSYFAGISVSGVITSVLRLITKGCFEHNKNGLRKGALMFFGITCLIELVCLVLYAYVFPKLPIVKYYQSKAALLQGSKTVATNIGCSAKAANVSMLSERLTNIQLISQNKDYIIGMFLIYVLTLSIYPGFLSEDTGNHSLGSWYALILITMFNVWTFIGKLVPFIKYLKITSRKLLLAAIISRIIFVPAFYLAVRYGGQGLMMILSSLLGLTTGHLSACIMTEAPKGYRGSEKNALGNLLAVSLLTGIFVGVLSDWLWLLGKKIK